MTGDDKAHLIYALLWLMLVASALVARRLPWRNTIKMALAWVAIFALMFAIFAYRHQFKALWSELVLAADPQSGRIEGKSLHIPMDEDGHFRVRAEINGTPVRFLIDSGATITAISQSAADAAKITPDAHAFSMAIETANGTIMARRLSIDRLAVGPIIRTEFRAITAPEFGETNVLGMNFLSTLKRWGVEGTTLILTP